MFRAAPKVSGEREAPHPAAVGLLVRFFTIIACIKLTPIRLSSKKEHMDIISILLTIIAQEF